MGSQDFQYIADLIHQRSAIVIGETKSYLVEARMTPLCREHGFADLEALVTALRREPGGALSDQVVDAMTTNETSFFRDVHPFDLLRTEIVPRIIESGEPCRKLNIWSAACSAGQEPVSIAILLKEHFPELEDWTVSILATDISSQMLERAASGRYSQLETNRGLPAALLTKHFERDGSTWQARKEVREMIEFRWMNLIEDWPAIPQFDVVFIRNVLIYFDIETKTQILGRIRNVLRPGGYLILGAAETTLNIDDNFERVPGTKTSCYQLAEA